MIILIIFSFEWEIIRKVNSFEVRHWQDLETIHVTTGQMPRAINREWKRLGVLCLISSGAALSRPCSRSLASLIQGRSSEVS